MSYNCRGVSCELNSADHIEYAGDLENEEGSDYHAAEVCMVREISKSHILPTI